MPCSAGSTMRSVFCESFIEYNLDETEPFLIGFQNHKLNTSTELLSGFEHGVYFNLCVKKQALCALRNVWTAHKSRKIFKTNCYIVIKAFSILYRSRSFTQSTLYSLKYHITAVHHKAKPSLKHCIAPCIAMLSLAWSITLRPRIARLSLARNILLWPCIARLSLTDVLRTT